MSETDRIRLLDLAASALKTLPDTPIVLKGLWTLATVKPEKKLSIGLLIERHAAKTPLATALVFEQKQWTYAAFNAWVNRIAASLAARGVASGDTVAVLMENRPETLACAACWRALKTDHLCSLKIDQGWTPRAVALGVVGL